MESNNGFFRGSFVVGSFGIGKSFTNPKWFGWNNFSVANNPMDLHLPV